MSEPGKAQAWVNVTDPEHLASINRGYYEAQFKEAESKRCSDCGAKPGERCWDYSINTRSPVRMERVVPHRERFEQ